MLSVDVDANIRSLASVIEMTWEEAQDLYYALGDGGADAEELLEVLKDKWEYVAQCRPGSPPGYIILQIVKGDS